MQLVGLHLEWYYLTMIVVLSFTWLLPLAIGFIYVRKDANRLGQTRSLRALLTIPLGWLAVLFYLLARMLHSAPVAR